MADRTISPGDSPRASWLDRLPAGWDDYARLARLDRPIGIWLLLFPCWWGLALAGSRRLDHYLLFALGAAVMRAAGCTINDLWDREIDARVARTAQRPLAAGRVSPAGALGFLLVLLAIGLAVLLCFDRRTIVVGALSLVVVIVYPLMKRVTWWPQMVLGIAFNWGVLVGWSASGRPFTLAPLMLYAAGLLWTLGYDTIYALQDIVDDQAIGVHSSARRLGRWVRPGIAAFYAAFAALICGVLRSAGHGPVAVALAGLALALPLAWQVLTLDPSDPGNCLARFRANLWVGWIVFGALAPLIVWR